MKKIVNGLRYLPVVAIACALSACAPQNNSGYTTNTAVLADPGTVDDFNANVGETVLFDFDSTQIRPDAQEILERQAAWLKQYPNYDILIEGHTDERGTREYNLALGQRRAVSIRNFLKAQGIPAKRINTVSYGKERPVATCDEEACWNQNRRGVTSLVGR